MSKQITVTQYAFWKKCKYMGKEEFGLLSYDFRQWPENERDGRIFVKEVQSTFDVPDDFDPIPLQIADLEAIKKSESAAFYARVTEIDRQIQSLLAIEHVQEDSHG